MTLIKDYLYELYRKFFNNVIIIDLDYLYNKQYQIVI